MNNEIPLRSKARQKDERKTLCESSTSFIGAFVDSLLFLLLCVAAICPYSFTFQLRVLLIDFYAPFGGTCAPHAFNLQHCDKVAIAYRNGGRNHIHFHENGLCLYMYIYYT